MISLKLFQFPVSNRSAVENAEEILRESIVYKREGFIAVSCDKPSGCVLSNTVKGVKIRNIALSKYILKRAIKRFSEKGYEVSVKYDDDGDVVKLSVKAGDEAIEINANGYISMPELKNSIIDTIVSIFLGDG